MSLEKKIRSFLQGPRKGESYELKNALVSQYKYERKDAIQRVIQAMTLGKDVSSLFPDVLKNIATYDLEQKKLVYLYLMNYAKTHPELCILAVNTFVQDTEDPNPLIRALAIRTMGCIRVSKMVDYMEIPLQRTLKDENPYVRKTAVISVAKLFDLNPEICIEFGFLQQLKELIHDPNPMVVSNALNSLYEINDINKTDNDILVIDYDLIKSLLVCLNECTEWGRITILRCVNDFTCQNRDQANHIIERVIPQLQHINPAIVLASIKAILNNFSVLQNAERDAILKKLSLPLISLISNPIPEAQYVGLKNIRIILEKYPLILNKELRVFFIKYSDPVYLKLEKLDIMIRLCNEGNFNLLLNELKEYSMEFEPLLIKKSIKSIGLIAIKLPNSIIKCINLIIELIDSRGGDLIINESINCLTTILRKYPGKNDLITLILPIITNNFNLDNSNGEATANYIFLLGEYPKYFTNLSSILNSLWEDFSEFTNQIKLVWLNSIIKVNLKSPSSQISSLLQNTFTEITENSDDIDLRDKAYIYWRLLSINDDQTTSNIILQKLPPIDSVLKNFNPVVLDELLKELGTLSSVYGKPSSTFIKTQSQDIKQSNNPTTNSHNEEIKDENLLDFNEDAGDANANGSILNDLTDLFSGNLNQNTDDILNLFNEMNVLQRKTSPPPISNETKNIDDLLDLF